MEKLFGRLGLETADGTLSETSELIEELNRTVKPPRAVEKDQVYLGVLFAASNQVNMQGGCFAAEELQQLAELVVDTPVMVGHKKQELPIGRIFKGKIVERQGTPWLKAYFYWRREQEGAEQLKANIESGVYRECSLAFLYERPECGLCRDDIRRCRHRLGATAGDNAGGPRTFFYYKDIIKVLEVSLVYRGAVEGTSVTTLSRGASENESISQLSPFWRSQALPIYSLTQIDTALDQVMLEPLYNGLWLDIVGHGDAIAAVSPSGDKFEHRILSRLPAAIRAKDFRVVCQLLPVKGASRMPLTAYYADPGRSCRLLIFDLLSLDSEDLATLPLPTRKERLREVFERSHQILAAPFFRCSFVDVPRLQDQKGSGLGMLITDLDDLHGRRCFELRRQGQLRGEVEADTTSERAGRFLIRFSAETQGSSGVRTCYRLSTGGRLLSAGSIVWARPLAGSESCFRFADICQPGSPVDSARKAAELAASAAATGFQLLTDVEGDMWLDLRSSAESRLLKINKLKPALLQGGRKFWCECIDCDEQGGAAVGRASLIDSGTLVFPGLRPDRALLLVLRGEVLNGCYCLEPARLQGRRGFLFSLAGMFTTPAGATAGSSQPARSSS